jgi:hypothetical protein
MNMQFEASHVAKQQELTWKQRVSYICKKKNKKKKELLIVRNCELQICMYDYCPSGQCSAPRFGDRSGFRGNLPLLAQSVELARRATITFTTET